MKKEYCVNQIFRPHNSAKGLNEKGVGNCPECVPDSENENCSLYTPISLTIFEVKEE